MHRPDWRKARDYDFCDTLNAGQWAWEFLRRNPDYQRDWQWFSAAWEVLEARYGKPPERNYQAWKNDPAAYRPVDDVAADCRVNEDNVLIECWMGARWGFYKFPLDPATNRPEIGAQLSWRPLEDSVPWIDASDLSYLGSEPGRVALGFQLDLPLRPQLEAARQLLQRRQARLRKQGRLEMRTVAIQGLRWTLMLRLLDGRNSGELLPEVRTAVGSGLNGRNPDELLREADSLVAGGYRQIAWLPEGRAV